MFSYPTAFYYSLTKFTPIQSRSENRLPWVGSKKYTVDKLNLKIKELEISSGVFLDPVIRSTNIQEKLSIRILKSIVMNTDREVLQNGPADLLGVLIQSALVLVQAYVAHLKINYSLWEKFKGIPFAKSVKYFHMLIIKLIPEKIDQTLDIIMYFLTNERLWNVEFLCCEILTSLLACQTSPAKILTQLLDYLEKNLKTNNVKEARHVVRILHKILYERFWCNQTAGECERIIHLYYDSITAMNAENPYYQMRRGFEMCLVRICEVMQYNELLIMIGIMFELCFGSVVPPEVVNDFSHAIEFAIMFVDNETITQIMTPQILQYILQAIASGNAKKSRIAGRLLARLFDRHNNFAEFITPRLFLPNKYYKIKISPYYAEDKDFLMQHRRQIEYHILLAVRQHQAIGNLETIFTILCTMLVESPCSYTVCQVVSILLELQDFGLGINGNACCPVTNQIHAMVMSVLMLIAWIHRTSSLSLYVQRILNRRADDAPHLNPPFKIVYQYAQHHVMWNEPSLFFDFWEIRHGLWKRFRSNELQLPLQGEGLKFHKQCRPSKSERVNDDIIASSIVRESVGTFF